MLRRTVVVILLLLVASAASAQERRPFRYGYRRHGNLHLRIGGDYSLPADSTADGPIVVIGGDAAIDGHAEDNVVVIGGDLRVGPMAVIDGDVSSIGGSTTIDAAAEIHGDVNRARFAWGAPRLGWSRFGNWWSRGVAFGATMLRLCLVLFGGLLLTLIVPGWMTTIARRVSDMPGVSAIIGFATEMFLGPAVLVLVIALVISIVGIPLLAGIPVLLAVLACVWIAGFTATAARVGASIRGRQAAWLEPSPGDFLIGFFVLTAVTIVGRTMALGPGWVSPIAALITSVGLFIEYCAWTLGLGAAVGALFAGHRQPPSVPPLPTPAA